MSINVGLNLPPQSRPCSAASESNPLDGHVQLMEDGEAVAQAERHTLENGADDMGASMGSRKPDQRGARIRVAMRSAFAHQVRRPEDSVRTGRSGCSFLTQELVRIPHVCYRIPDRITVPNTEAIAEPAQREAGRLRHTHHMPSSGDGMAEGMNSPLRIKRG